MVLAENGGHHLPFTQRAKPWLNQLAKDSGFAVDYLQSPQTITAKMLEGYQLFIQLDYPPYGWGDSAEAAFKAYIEQGKGGWIGFHHASLLGEFDGYGMWPWFYTFMGSVRWKNYIATFATATVQKEDSMHPVMKNLPECFSIEKYSFHIRLPLNML